VYSFGRAALLLLVEVQNHTVPVRERRRIRVNTRLSRKKIRKQTPITTLSTMSVICDFILYNLGPQCTNDLMNAPCCFSASTPEGLHDDKLLLVERRHSVVLRESFCLTQMNLKTKNSAQNEESLYSAVLIYVWFENLEHACKQRFVRIHPNYPIKFFKLFSETA